MNSLNNEFEIQEIINTFVKNLNIDKKELIDLFELINNNNKNLNNNNIKHIFKILLNYTYKLRKNEIEMNKHYEDNFNEINIAMKKIEEQIKQILEKEPKEPTPPPPS